MLNYLNLKQWLLYSLMRLQLVYHHWLDVWFPWEEYMMDVLDNNLHLVKQRLWNSEN